MRAQRRWDELSFSVCRGCSTKIILIYFVLYLVCLAFSEIQRSDSTLVVHVFDELRRNQPPAKHLEGFGENGALIRILQSRSPFQRKTWPSGNLQKCSGFWQLFDNPSAPHAIFIYNNIQDSFWETQKFAVPNLDKWIASQPNRETAVDVPHWEICVSMEFSVKQK